MFNGIEIIFWLSILLLAHTYLFYPVLIATLAYVAGRPNRATTTYLDEALPSITVLIAAYNADKSIRDRVNNLLQSDYPIHRLQIIVASDGSNDGTVAAVRSLNHPSVSVIAFSERSGKAATLVRAMRSVQSEVVIFTDATTRFAPDSIRAIGVRFLDPKVGIVSGSVRMVDSSGTSCEGAYWKLEAFVRQAEAALGILTGVSGAIYGMRRSVFVPPNRPTTNDDMVLPILAKHQHRCRFVHEPNAVAEVRLPDQAKLESIRRRRIGCGAFQSLGLLAPAMMPSNGLSAFALISHKILRWLGPLALLAAFASNCLLLSSTLYRWVFILQVLFYALAFAGWCLPNRNKAIRIARVATSFVSMNFALLLGFTDWLRAAGQVTWEPTPRPDSIAPPS